MLCVLGPAGVPRRIDRLSHDRGEAEVRLLQGQFAGSNLTEFPKRSTLYVQKSPMSTTAAKKKRTERFNVRLSEREARLIRLGAEQRGVNITNFILESACVRAEQEIAEARHFKLSSRDWQKFSEALDRPAKTKPRLRKLFAESTILEQG